MGADGGLLVSTCRPTDARAAGAGVTCRSPTADDDWLTAGERPEQIRRPSGKSTEDSRHGCVASGRHPYAWPYVVFKPRDGSGWQSTEGSHPLAIPFPPPNTPDSFVSYPAITTSGQGTFVSLGSRRKRALKKLNLFPPASLNSAIASKKRRAPRSACPRRKSSYICIYTHSVCRAVIVVRRSCCPRFNKPRSIGSSTMTEGRGQANAPAMAGDDVDQLLGQIVQEQMAHMPQVGS